MIPHRPEAPEIVDSFYPDAELSYDENLTPHSNGM